MILFACPSCRADLEADLEFAGEPIVCPSCQADVVVPAGAIAKGTLVGGYSIERHLGGGGMGEVYEATQLSVGRRVALKILPPNLARHPAFTSAFLHEARKLARIDQAGIVPVIDVGQESDCFYIATTLVSGEDLARRLERGGRMPEVEALQLALQVSQILRVCWERYELPHLDLKPSNIMVDSDGNIRLLDVGLTGHLLSGEADLSFARDLILSPYISPEQALGSTKLDFRSDLYSLGAVLYHLVTGRRPYAGTSSGDLALRVESQPFPPAREVNPDLSPGLEQLLLDFTLKEPTRRPANWDDAIERIEQLLAKPAHAPAHAHGGAPHKVTLKPAQRTHAGSHPHVIKVKAPQLAAHSHRPVKGPAVMPWVVAVIVILVAGGVYFGLKSNQHRARVEQTYSAAQAAAAAGEAEESRARAAGFVEAARRFIADYPKDHAGGRAQIEAARKMLAEKGLEAAFASELDALTRQIAEAETKAHPAYQHKPQPAAPANPEGFAVIGEDEGTTPPATEPAPPKKKEDPLQQAAARLLERDYDGAKSLLEKTDDAQKAKLQEELPALVNWVDAIYDELRAAVGREETFRFRDGTRSLVVRGVAPPSIRAERVARDGERVVGRSATTFRLEELSTEELVRRLNGSANGGRAIMCGLLAYRGGQLSDARAWFNRSDSPWGPLLVRAMDDAIAPTI